MKKRKKKEEKLVHVLPRSESFWVPKILLLGFVIGSVLWSFETYGTLKHKLLLTVSSLVFGVVCSMGVYIVFRINYRRHKKILEQGIKGEGIVRAVKQYYIPHWGTYYAVIIDYYAAGEKRIWCSPKYDDDLNDYFKCGDSCEVYYLGNKVCLPEYLYKKY